MSQRVNYFRIGLFVVAAALAGVGVLAVVGGRAYFGSESIMLESYFDESVEGLDVGSSVTRRGVKIGRVKEIGFVRDVYDLDPENENYELFARSVRVVIEMSAEREGQTETEVRVRARDEVARGLRVFLRPKGLTGTARLEVDFVDARSAEPPPVGWNPIGVYLPSAPGTLDRVTSGIDRVLYQLERVDLKGVFAGTMELLSEVRATNLQLTSWFEELRAAQLDDVVRGTLRDAGGLLSTTQQSIENVGNAVEAAAQRVSAVGGDVAEALAESDVSSVVQRAESALARVEYLLADGQRDMGDTLANLRSVSENLAELTGLLKAHPSLAVFATAPAEASATQP